MITYVDGGYDNIRKQNPYFSYKVYYRDEQTVDDLIAWVKKQESNSTTNNEAEYDGLIDLLTYLQNMHFNNKHIIIYMDSKLVVEQMNCRWQVKSLSLQDRWKKATRIGNGLDYHLVWVPRETMVRELGH